MLSLFLSPSQAALAVIKSVYIYAAIKMDSVRAVSFPQDTSRAASVLSKLLGPAPPPFLQPPWHVQYTSPGNRETDDIYNGDLSLKQEPLYKTVRIYISSELSGQQLTQSWN